MRIEISHIGIIRTIILLITIEDNNEAYVLYRNPIREEHDSPIVTRRKSQEDLIKLTFGKWIIHLNFYSTKQNLLDNLYLISKIGII